MMQRFGRVRTEEVRVGSQCDSFEARATFLTPDGRSLEAYRLDRLDSVADVSRLPFSLKILLENLLRHEGDGAVSAADIEALARWDSAAEPWREISFAPARILLQDFTGVPAVVDLAAMRDAMAAMGGDPDLVNPQIPVELVIDHSVVADVAGVPEAFSSCDGAKARSTTSRSCPPTPGSAIRSTWSTWPGWYSSTTPPAWSTPTPW